MRRRKRRLVVVAASFGVWSDTPEVAAVVAAHSVAPDRWWAEFGAVIDRIAARFPRYEPLRHAAGPDVPRSIWNVGNGKWIPPDPITD